MKVFIVTEGGTGIGFGHATRCLSLYHAFEKKGIVPELLINGDVTGEDVSDFRKHRIFNWLAEKERLFEIIKGADAVVMDSYLGGLDIYIKVSQLAKKAIYIDDCKRLNYPKGIVVNGTVYAHGLNWPRRKDISYMLGSRYLPMRQEFWSVPKKKIRKKAARIMVTFGGYDYKFMSPKILRVLCENYKNMIKNVIVGRGFKNKDEIKKNKGCNTNLIYNPNATMMKNAMLDADIAISSGGQTLYELARLGVPTVGICMADNQEKNLESWQEKRFVSYAGWYNDDRILSKVLKSIDNILSYNERVKRSRAGRALVDGKGAERVINALAK